MQADFAAAEGLQTVERRRVFVADKQRPAARQLPDGRLAAAACAQVAIVEVKLRTKLYRIHPAKAAVVA
jgi:hypothetical protein